MSLSMTLGHVLLLEMSGLFSVWLQTKRNRCLGLRRHEGLEEWDGSAKISRSQSVFVAGGGGIVHNLGLGNGPVSLSGDGRREQRLWAVEAWKESWTSPTALGPLS